MDIPGATYHSRPNFIRRRPETVIFTSSQPWLNRFDVRFAQTVPTIRGQGLQVMLNIINFANLLNKDWGKSEFVTNQASQVLQTQSTTPVNGRVQFRAFGPDRREFNTSNLNSRYQIQLGLRYSF